MDNTKIYEEAKKRYNSLMFDLCLEFLTIGTRFSEDTDNWGVSDMVRECKYQLSVCFEDGNANSDGRYTYEYMDMYGCGIEEAEEAHKAWLSKTMKLRNFIRKYDSL